MTPIAPVDLLVFGPHPDDIEIGLGGTIARHAAGPRSRPVRPHGRRARQQRDAGRAAGGSARGRARARRRLAREPRLAGRRHRQRGAIRSAVDFIRRHRPRTIAVPHWQDRHPDHVATSEVLAPRSSRAACADTNRRRSVAARVDLLLLHQRRRRRRSSSTSLPHYERKRAALACFRTQFAPRAEAAATRLTPPTFRQLIESRDAQFGALAGVAFAEGVVVREPSCGRDCFAPAMRIGIVCYASVGGSGVVATELAHALAVRGHQVHLISSEVPFRWREGCPGSGSSGLHASVPAVSRAAVPAGPRQHDRPRRRRSRSSMSCTHTTRSRMRQPPISPPRCWQRRSRPAHAR